MECGAEGMIIPEGHRMQGVQDVVEGIKIGGGVIRGPILIFSSMNLVHRAVLHARLVIGVRRGLGLVLEVRHRLRLQHPDHFVRMGRVRVESRARRVPQIVDYVPPPPVFLRFPQDLGVFHIVRHVMGQA